MEALTNLVLNLILYNPTFIAAFVICIILSSATYWFINRDSASKSTKANENQQDIQTANTATLQSQAELGAINTSTTENTATSQAEATQAVQQHRSNLLSNSHPTLRNKKRLSAAQQAEHRQQRDIVRKESPTSQELVTTRQRSGNQLHAFFDHINNRQSFESFFTQLRNENRQASKITEENSELNKMYIRKAITQRSVKCQNQNMNEPQIYTEDPITLKTKKDEDTMIKAILLEHLPSCIAWAVFKNTEFRHQSSKSANITEVVSIITSYIDETDLCEWLSANSETIASNAVRPYREQKANHGFSDDVIENVNRLQNILKSSLESYCNKNKKILIKHFLLGIMIDNHNQVQEEYQLKTLVNFTCTKIVEDVKTAIEIHRKFSRAAFKFKENGKIYTIIDGVDRRDRRKKSNDSLSTVTNMLRQDYEEISKTFLVLDNSAKQSEANLIREIDDQREATQVQKEEFEALSEDIDNILKGYTGDDRGFGNSALLGGSWNGDEENIPPSLDL